MEMGAASSGSRHDLLKLAQCCERGDAPYLSRRHLAGGLRRLLISLKPPSRAGCWLWSGGGTNPPNRSFCTTSMVATQKSGGCPQQGYHKKCIRHWPLAWTPRQQVEPTCHDRHHHCTFRCWTLPLQGSSCAHCLHAGLAEAGHVSATPESTCGSLDFLRQGCRPERASLRSLKPVSVAQPGVDPAS